MPPDFRAPDARPAGQPHRRGLDPVLSWLGLSWLDPVLSGLDPVPTWLDRGLSG